MNEEKERFVFDIEEPIEKFTKHLNVSFNDRIIFSAPFGAGKTYFLKEYFKKSNSKYETIHLYPVNYSIASNEDIFELIKYDILFELFGKDVEFDKVEFNKLDFLPFYLKNNIKSAIETITPLLSFIPKVGKTLAELSEKLLSFHNNFKKQSKEIQIDDEKATLNYLESFGERNSSIKEDDFYSQLIRQLVEQLHGGYSDKPQKETVLIIDDLDRIDPHHIFRILNVLSAHMDVDSSENKFGFDKIILVFDQYNVRNIFRNRYGTDVDYTGYIDKFYSYKIFNFSNIKGLEKDITRILESIKRDGKKINFDKEIEFNQGITYVFRKLVQANALTVRRLLKVKNQTMKYRHNFNSFNYSNVRFKGQFHFLLLAELLLFIYEDWNELLYSIKKLTELNFNEDINNRLFIESLINESILLLDSENHNFEEKEAQYEYINEENSLSINYSFGYEKFKREFHCTFQVNEVKELDDPKLLSVLYLTLKEIREKRILN